MSAEPETSLSKREKIASIVVCRDGKITTISAYLLIKVSIEYTLG